LDYAADWLSGKDFKTLAQTAEGMVFLSHVLSKQSTDAAWQEGVASFARNAQKLIALAQDEDAAACGELIGVLRKDAARLADWKPPPGDAAVAPGGRGSSEANPAGQRQRGSLRSFMALLDGTYADAKAALTFGEPQTAKSTAHVLHALGELLSNQRSDAGWLQHSRDFSQAALEAAQLESDDETAVRQKLRGVYDQCEKCHNRAR
jgi:cytochrome c556